MIVFKQQGQNQIIKLWKKKIFGGIKKAIINCKLIKWWWATGGIILIVGVAGVNHFNLVPRLKNKTKLIKEHLITGYYRLTVKPRESLLLDIKFKDVKTLTDKRNEALIRGVLFSNDDDLVSADIRYGEETIPVKIRLKGDWLDHLSTNKWSLRVEVEDEKEIFKGMRRFSLQVPEARNYINEWLFLKTLKDEGLISLNYDFLKISINGEAQGIYALEEHTSKEVIERNERREGPILKFNADQFWNTVYHFGGKSRFSAREHLVDGYYFKSLIEPFQQSQLESDPVLAELLQLAVNKLQAYREGVLAPSEVFDYEAWSKYLVLADIFGADHGFFWENYRFYFNPITGKFEPIPFDNEPGKVIEYLAIHEQEPEPLTQLFNDPEFVREYIKMLNQYAKQEYVGQKLSSYSKEIEYYTKLLKQDYPDYKFDPMSFFENVDFMQQSVLTEQGVRVRVNKELTETDYLTVENLMHLPIEIVGVFQDEKMENNLLVEQGKILKGGLTYELPETEKLLLSQSVSLDKNGLKNIIVSFRLWGKDELSTTQTVGVEQSLISKIDWQPGNIPESSGFIKFDQAANVYVVPKGNFVLNKLIIIPKGSKFYVAAGVKIDLKQGGGIVSYSPVEFDGNELNPILLTSSDGKGQGLSVIKANGNRIEHTNFSKLQPIDQQAYTNTGAIVFYESAVTIKNSSFRANQAEDQLNIVRSKFLLDKLQVIEATSDGLDVDFGVGKLVDCSFVEITNDAVDFSGSQIEIDGLMVDGAGDKGISAGERSTLKVNNIKISNAKLGVASKDLSEVTLGKQIEFNDLEVGLAAYQKKPEFGPGYINQDLITANNVKAGFVIEKGSILKQPWNSVVKGNEKNVGERFQ